MGERSPCFSNSPRWAELLASSWQKHQTWPLHVASQRLVLGSKGFPGSSAVKNPPTSAEDMGSIPGSGRLPGEGNGSPFQVLTWEIPWTEEPVELQSIGLQRVRQDLVTEQQLGQRAARETRPIALKLQLVRWTPWNLSDLTQDGHKNKTLFYLVLDHRGLCGPVSPFLEMPSKSWSLSASG